MNRLKKELNKAIFDLCFYIKILVKIAFFLLKIFKNGRGRLGTVEDGWRRLRTVEGTGTGRGRERKRMGRAKDRNFHCIISLHMGGLQI